MPVHAECSVQGRTRKTVPEVNMIVRRKKLHSPRCFVPKANHHPMIVSFGCGRTIAWRNTTSYKSHIMPSSKPVFLPSVRNPSRAVFNWKEFWWCSYIHVLNFPVRRKCLKLCYCLFSGQVPSFDQNLVHVC